MVPARPTGSLVLPGAAEAAWRSVGAETVNKKRERRTRSDIHISMDNSVAEFKMEGSAKERETETIWVTIPTREDP